MKEVLRFPTVGDVRKARENIKNAVYTTPLQENHRLSEKFGAKIFLRREDL